MTSSLYTRRTVPARAAAFGLAAFGVLTVTSNLSTIRAQDSLQIAPAVACFAEGTDSEYVAQVSQTVEALNQANMGSQYYINNRWSGTTGSPRALTYSFVPDGLSISGGAGEPTSASNLFAQMDAKFAAQGGRATWLLRVQQCFDRWGQLAGVSYTKVTAAGVDWDDGAGWGTGGGATRGDIRVSAHNIDGVNGILAYTFFPSNGDMVLDSSESYGSSSNLHRFLRNTFTHEAGHGLGLLHVCSSNTGILMEPFLSTSFDGPQHDDLRATEALYGDPFEDDNTAGTANDIGTILSGASVSTTCNMPAGVNGANPTNTTICSIDANGEADYFKFTVTGTSSVTVSVTPQGFSYDDSSQDQTTGACNTGTTTNSLTRANLNVQIIGSNGVNVLGTGASAAAGVVETLSNVSVPAGIGYIKVYEGDTPTQSQLYKFTVTVQASCLGLPDCNGNGVLDSCDITGGTSLDNNGNGIPDECDGFVGNANCAGDSTDPFFQPCPCENNGAIGNGCANSVDPAGAQLAVGGLTNPDSIALNCSGMPTTVSAIFLKGDTFNSTGIVFGDGVRCVDGALIRLGTETNVGGASTYPTGAQSTVSVRGATPPGSGLNGYYQTYYRNSAAAFCPPETFNVSNGFQITW